MQTSSTEYFFLQSTCFLLVDIHTTCDVAGVEIPQYLRGYPEFPQMSNSLCLVLFITESVYSTQARLLVMWTPQYLKLLTLSTEDPLILKGGSSKSLLSVP